MANEFEARALKAERELKAFKAYAGFSQQELALLYEPAFIEKIEEMQRQKNQNAQSETKTKPKEEPATDAPSMEEVRKWEEANAAEETTKPAAPSTVITPEVVPSKPVSTSIPTTPVFTEDLKKVIAAKELFASLDKGEVQQVHKERKGIKYYHTDARGYECKTMEDVVVKNGIDDKEFKALLGREKELDLNGNGVLDEGDIKRIYTSGGKLHDGADLAIKNMRAAGIEIAKEGSNNKTATASQPKAIDAKDGGGRGN
jgi:hypothetical protein